ADLLTKELLNYASKNDDLFVCIGRYNEKMRARSSKDVQSSRNIALEQNIPVGTFGFIFRYLTLRAFTIFIYIVVFIQTRSS
ncbi:34863_t:CDS:1, partial [Racocetra persica]